MPRKKAGKKEIRFTISSNRLLPASLEHLEVNEVADGEDIERAVTMSRSALFARVRALDAVSAVRIVFTLPTRT